MCRYKHVCFSHADFTLWFLGKRRIKEQNDPQNDLQLTAGDGQAANPRTVWVNSRRLDPISDQPNAAKEQIEQRLVRFQQQSNCHYWTLKGENVSFATWWSKVRGESPNWEHEYVSWTKDEEDGVFQVLDGCEHFKEKI